MTSPPVMHEPADLALFRSLLSVRAGIALGGSSEVYLERRLRRRMQQTGARSLSEYYRMVSSSLTGSGELQALVDEVSIGETAFFRNPAHFEIFARMVLPERLRVRRDEGNRRLRIWSAGCSTGQETYSIAMVLLEAGIFLDTWRVTLTGTDISSRAVAKARAGEYTQEQMGGVDPERRQHYFERRGARLAVREWVRRGVELLQGNILDGPRWTDADVVFCRNVMIYFDAEGQRRMARRLAETMAPGGYLFVGPTESLHGLTDAFRLVAAHGGIVYQRVP